MLPNPEKTKDTLKAITDTIKKFDYPHIFRQNKLVPVEKNILEEVPQAEMWPSYFLFFVLGLLFFVYLSLHKKNTQLFRGSFSLQSARTLEREEFRITRREPVILSFVYLAGLSFLVFKINVKYSFIPLNNDTFLQYLAICSGVFLVYTLKFVFLWLTGFILSVEKAALEYRYNVFITAHIAGVFLLLTSFGLEFVQVADLPLIIIGLSGFGFFYLIRIMKGILIAREIRNFSFFQLFIYLCCLEILPLAVLIVFLSRLSFYITNL